MVRFSCFNGHLTSNKSKKAAASSAENGVPSTSQNQAVNPTSLKDSSLMERGWKSDDIVKGMDVGQIRRLKKSQSLESGLENKGKSIVDHMDNEADGAFSDEIVAKTRHMTMEENASSPPSAGDLLQKPPIFSIGELHASDNVKHENYDADLPIYRAGEDSGDHTPRTPPLIVRPRSLPNIGASSPVSMGYSREFGQRSRSSEDLLILGMRHNDTSNYELKMQLRPRDGGAYDNPNTGYQNDGDDDGYPNSSYHVQSGDRIEPAEDEVLLKSLQEVGLPSDDSPGKDFRFKRIQKWVIDLEPCIPSEVVDESFQTDDEAVADHSIIDGIEVKAGMKVSPGMEAAKRYISSLSSSAASCQLGNHGLEVIPFLSAFASLKVVNLFGNNIARITAGALPRGLHVLNLSRNRISTIEGLRELTRLRVLDLSYNRIFRIGHGLASCSSLKELYLAGNKISEVEGLHRLLKLSVLDLRFNKISTAKCLGQLAANYNSLQAISLEGNPAQKNVGDEQLKKNLQGLLPHLAYYNKQHLKLSTLKESSERAVRLGSSSSYQFDRNLRSDAKTLKKGGQSIASKPASSSHSKRSHAGTLSSKTKHSRLPPIATRPTPHLQSQQYYFDLGEKLRSLKPDLSMRRSRSEGTLGAL